MLIPQGKRVGARPVIRGAVMKGLCLLLAAELTHQ